MAEEEFENLKERLIYECEDSKPSVIYDVQMRKAENWWGRQRPNVDDNKPVYCFALSHHPWRGESEIERPNLIIMIFILVPQHCSIYHFANFIASSKHMACAAANSKIYLFGPDCGNRLLYRDVVVEGVGDKRWNVWNQAKPCFNREKCKPISFSLGNKIYALETCYLTRPVWKDELYNDDDDCWFEVLDTSTIDDDDNDVSCWVPLCNPPYPFGGCEVLGSWTSNDTDRYRIFIDTSSTLGEVGLYLFVYDVNTNTWDKFKRYHPLRLVHHPKIHLEGNPFYTWALHSIGKDFAPFPPHEPYTGDLRVLTGLKRSIPELQRLASERQQGLSLPFPVKVETDRKEKLIVPCKNSSRNLTGHHMESLWTLHCLPVERLILWEAIHLGGSRFCTLAYYTQQCCFRHSFLYVRVANFDVTDDAAADDGGSEPVFSAQYGPNKVYILGKAISVSLLPCCKLA